MKSYPTEPPPLLSGKGVPQLNIPLYRFANLQYHTIHRGSWIKMFKSMVYLLPCRGESFVLSVHITFYSLYSGGVPLGFRSVKWHEYVSKRETFIMLWFYLLLNDQTVWAVFWTIFIIFLLWLPTAGHLPTASKLSTYQELPLIAGC